MNEITLEGCLKMYEQGMAAIINDGKVIEFVKEK